MLGNVSLRNARAHGCSFLVTRSGASAPLSFAFAALGRMSVSSLRFSSLVNLAVGCELQSTINRKGATRPNHK